MKQKNSEMINWVLGILFLIGTVTLIAVWIVLSHTPSVSYPSPPPLPN